PSASWPRTCTTPKTRCRTRKHSTSSESGLAVGDAPSFIANSGLRRVQSPQFRTRKPNMHHARQHAESRTRERRRRLAHEAARLMAESGIRDYHQAKLKAADRLGIHDDASLPRNREIEDALREYQRLFQGHATAAAQQARQETAVRTHEFVAPLEPRHVGP